MRITIQRVDNTLPLPAYASAGATAFDIYSRIDTVVEPHTIARIPSNLIIEVPDGYTLLVFSRSSLPGKKGLMKANGVGVIDQDYHGPHDEISMQVFNFTNVPAHIACGERLGQAMLVPIVRAEWNEVKKMESPNRGGFGSTAGYTHA